MKVGDLVEKKVPLHDRHADEIGVMLSIATNSAGNTIAKVYSCGEIKSWWTEYIRVIN